MIRPISLLLAFSLALGGCSSFSKSARQQRAYTKYVRKQSITRVKQSSRFRAGKSHMPPAQAPADPVVTAESGPQAFSSSEGQAQ